MCSDYFVPPLTQPFMDDPSRNHTQNEPIPLGQRLFDNVFLLLGVGLVIMFIVFTGWGLFEIYTLPPATLP